MSRGFCMTHKSVPAKTHCHQCHRPVCDECISETSLGQFCSADCASKFAQFQARWKGGSKPRGGLIKSLVGVVFLIAIAMGAIHAAKRFGGITALAPFDVIGKYLLKK